MIHLELTEYEASCAVAHLTKRKDDITQAVKAVGHLLSKRDQHELIGDIAQINSLCERLNSELTKVQTAAKKSAENKKLRKESFGQKLYDADPNCDHDIEAQWSGVKCTKCSGWYCA